MTDHNPLAGLDLPQDSLEKLHIYVDMLVHWNRRINLISPKTVPDLWQRHILDSAQLMQLAPQQPQSWVDLGSGGGLPGIVCAILAAHHSPQCRFVLVESDQRKAAFLRSVARELGLTLQVLAQRAEHVPPLAAQVVSSRALAPLPILLPLIHRHIAANGCAVLPKGKTYQEELEALSQEWQFELNLVQSQTDPLARVLILTHISHIQG